MPAVSMRQLTVPVRLLLIWSVRGYQTFISPALPRRCKYYPSCSQYAVDALLQYGVLRGIVLAGWRLLRCNPLSYGGYDPVDRQTLFPLRGRRGRSCTCTPAFSATQGAVEVAEGKVEAGENPESTGHVVMAARRAA